MDEAHEKDFNDRMMAALKAAYPKSGDSMDAIVCLLKASAGIAVVDGVSEAMFVDFARELFHVATASLEEFSAGDVVPATAEPQARGSAPVAVTFYPDGT